MAARPSPPCVHRQQTSWHYSGYRSTGSGKTTTLYGALSDLNDTSRNIPVEDPIEYSLPGIGQKLQVNTKVDMTFAKGLRAYFASRPRCGDDRRNP